MESWQFDSANLPGLLPDLDRNLFLCRTLKQPKRPAGPDPSPRPSKHLVPAHPRKPGYAPQTARKAAFVCIRAWLQPCRRIVQGEDGASAPAMARPARNANPRNRPLHANILRHRKNSYGAPPSSNRSGTRPFSIDVLGSCVAERGFKLLDFVIMPDHIHLLVTVPDGMTIEKAMQLVKGRFSYRLKKDLGYLGVSATRVF